MLQNLPSMVGKQLCCQLLDLCGYYIKETLVEFNLVLWVYGVSQVMLSSKKQNLIITETLKQVFF